MAVLQMVLGFLVFVPLCGAVQISDPLNHASVNQPFNFGLGPDNYVSGSIWPKPQQQVFGKETFQLSPSDFSFSPTGEQSDVLERAIKRYTLLTFPTQLRPIDEQNLLLGSLVMSSLEINVKTPYQDMTPETDESYELFVEAPKSTLTANTVWGALRGLETFSQLVYQDEQGHFLARERKITDFPRFHFRGFLIDTSRHYINVPIILRHIDALSFAKFNVLHWHIVDDPSFPFVSEKFPSLSNTGAYNNKTHIYTPDDVKRVIEYARDRGIRVVPEFDTPGHTQSWVSIKDLLTPCYNKGKATGNYGPINPTLNSTYDFLKSFFGEIAERFPDQYVHLGGDEVSFSCWQSNPDINAWMQKMGFGKNFSLLEQYYEQHLLDIVGSLKKKYIIWQEVVDNEVTVKPDTVVNVWKSPWDKEMAKVTSKKLNTILSTPWYLNYISYGNDWPKYYQVEPTKFNGTKEQQALVIGGTACMWGEWVDGTNLLPRSWPRALAVSERLWSSFDTTDVADAERRLREHRCRYLLRGIPAENGVQTVFCRYEWPGPV